MKKMLSLALAGALCLSLTMPAFAAGKPGETTVTDAQGNVYTLSKPILRTISREEIDELPFADDYKRIEYEGEVEMDSADSLLNDISVAYEVPIGTVVTVPNGIEFDGFGLVELGTVDGETAAVCEMFEPPYLGELELDYRDLGWHNTFWVLPCNAVTEEHSGNQGTPVGQIVFYTAKVDDTAAEMQSFTDVAPDAYYADSVNWAVENAITSGTSDTTFSPDQTCTTAQILTFLWKAKGAPEPAGTDNPFTDVKPSDYFYKAALWARENKIVSQTDAALRGDAPCTRSMAVLYIWRAAGFPAAKAPSRFADVAATTLYAPAVDWAVENAITSGTSETEFSPDATCTRAQIMTFLYRAFAEA